MENGLLFRLIITGLVFLFVLFGAFWLLFKYWRDSNRNKWAEYLMKGALRYGSIPTGSDAASAGFMIKN